ncbi:putative defender against cell death 1 [Filobasidium floriforme]|uniref:putative defender against cell death 1 n=1 Tax=Filobasidium floriforme TaxID=5210 RepID=UPI001E8DCAAD|nr:putative defender against cell death 1 [Filobasidium floriforme]KAH8086890.1 putative defender against cell death 1 [Filobasidium floriforme]
MRDDYVQEKAQLDALSRSITSLRTAYIQTTPIRIKLIDSFLAFFVVIGVLLMAYRIGVTSYPFNGFLASFGGVVGQFVLMAGLRSQVAPGRDEEYGEVISPERAFADFCFASVVLHVFMFNFLG